MMDQDDQATIQSRARSRSSRSRPQTPELTRIVSVQHIDDDQSFYHSHDNDQFSDTSDQIRSDDEEKAREEGEDKIAEIRNGMSDKTDLEAGPVERRKTTESAKDPNIVTWDGPDDPENPKNFPFCKKWAATFVVSCYTFISPVSSSMVAPALQSIAHDFHITNVVEMQLVLSIFVLAYAIGPLFIGPMSELYGRAHVLQLANLFYLIFNIACGVSQSKGQMFAFRFLAGLGGSAPLAIGGGLLSDLFLPEERGKAVSIYSLAPLLGPAIGPIAGGFITEKTTWRWAFHATSLATVAIQAMGLIFLQETYAPKILHDKAKKLRKETGNMELKTEYEHPERTVTNTVRRALFRPFRLLGTQIIVQLLAIYMAYLYGSLYLVLSTFPSLWEGVYHESVGIGGLNYISIAVGCMFGSQICAPLNDRVYRYLKRTNKTNPGVGRPEFRVLLMIAISPFVPIGLFIYGFTAAHHTHWIWPNIGACIFSAGIIVGFQCIQTYLVDSYPRFAASAIGAATVLRSLAGFGFPLFAPAMYDSLGYGWGNALLGFIAIGIGFPAPVLLWFYGEKLRKMSPFAAGG